MTHLMLCQVLNPLANGSFIPGLINLESPFPSPAAAATSHHGREDERWLQKGHRERRYDRRRGQQQGVVQRQSLDQGLSKLIRDALPIVIYSEGCAVSMLDNQFAVCLGDYQKNDKLQQLPVCACVFHKDCVNEWLANHSTCPICQSVAIPSGKMAPMVSSARECCLHFGSTRLLLVLHAPRSTSASKPGLHGTGICNPI
ncbi:hypothetical protein CY35_13G090200 [Sphagnum magellanicum]|nr:hypothetical protein CY35_13G090200 [Sphagnum magellanicum]